MDDFVREIERYCPGIRIFVIPEKEIDLQYKFIEDNPSNIRPFSDGDVKKIMPGTSTNKNINYGDAKVVENGDFVLVKYEINGKKYRYAGVCSSDFNDDKEII
ncbi:hypothetical protein ACJJTC_006906 [Scirpophaga incertulas]